MGKKWIRMPRLLWSRCPSTQVMPNKKALLSKMACRKKGGKRKEVFDDDERLC